MKNPGKQFEEDFKNSVPHGVIYYRLRDTASSYSQGEKSRFTVKNVCDCILIDGKVSCFLEMKSYSGSSVSLGSIVVKQKEGSARKPFNKLEELVNFSFTPNVAAGYIFNMRDHGNATFYLTARQVDSFVTHYARKSIPISFMRDFGIVIFSDKKKVHYTYDIPRFLKQAHVSTHGQ